MAPPPATALRQRGTSTAQPTPAAALQQQSVADDTPLSFSDKANFYFAQHVGLVICGGGITLLGCGYDKGWMNNTHLCLLCLAFCLVGLFFHELRPFNAQTIIDEQNNKAE